MKQTERNGATIKTVEAHECMARAFRYNEIFFFNVLKHVHIEIVPYVNYDSISYDKYTRIPKHLFHMICLPFGQTATASIVVCLELCSVR